MQRVIINPSDRKHFVGFERSGLTFAFKTRADDVVKPSARDWGATSRTG
jgi:hypothetical protein